MYSFMNTLVLECSYSICRIGCFIRPILWRHGSFTALLQWFNWVLHFRQLNRVTMVLLLRVVNKKWRQKYIGLQYSKRPVDTGCVWRARSFFSLFSISVLSVQLWNDCMLCVSLRVSCSPFWCSLGILLRISYFNHDFWHSSTFFW